MHSSSFFRQGIGLIGLALSLALAAPAAAEDLTIGADGRVTIELIGADAQFSNTLSVESPDVALASAGCRLEPAGGLSGVHVASEKRSQRGCRVSLDSDPSTAGIQPFTTREGFADARSWGYRLVVRPTFNRAIGAINLEPVVAFQHDVQGTTPAPIVNFVDGRKAVTVALKGFYLERMTAEVGFTTFFDGGEHNLLKDRDFISIAFSYSF